MRLRIAGSEERRGRGPLLPHAVRRGALPLVMALGLTIVHAPRATPPEATTPRAHTAASVQPLAKRLLMPRRPASKHVSEVRELRHALAAVDRALAEVEAEPTESALERLRSEHGAARTRVSALRGSLSRGPGGGASPTFVRRLGALVSEVDHLLADPAAQTARLPHARAMIREALRGQREQRELTLTVTLDPSAGSPPVQAEERRARGGGR